MNFVDLTLWAGVEELLFKRIISFVLKQIWKAWKNLTAIVPLFVPYQKQEIVLTLTGLGFFWH